MTRHRWALIWLILLGPFSLFGLVEAELVVNEALVNEPSDSVALEWFELFNNSGSSVNLAFYEVTIGSNVFLLQGDMQSGGYAVVCRDSARFVNRWGSETEETDYPIITRTFSLVNTGGTIQLSLFGGFESALTWTESGADGFSWERLLPARDTVALSNDPKGATPGGVNSVTPLPRDLALIEVSASRYENGALINFVMGNSGLSQVADGQLTLYLIDPQNPESRDSTVLTVTLPPIDTGFTTIVQRSVFLAGYYAQLEASLAEDDRPVNNTKRFMVPGADYPPIILNEFLANPLGALASEWLELYNRSDSSLDISSWLIGDENRLEEIGGALITLDPGDYLLVVEDSQLFKAHYLMLDGGLAQPDSWPTLNNSGDLLRLVDQYGFEADRFAYTALFDSNITWSRSQLSDEDTVWGRSLLPNGSPGEKNSILIQPAETGLRISIAPSIFSPDGDGVDDETTITIGAPFSSEYTMKIYDRQGRVVKSFEENSAYLAEGGVYRWDGRADSGNRLPIGIYILYFEAGKVESLKKTVVIAR